MTQLFFPAVTDGFVVLEQKSRTVGPRSYRSSNRMSLVHKNLLCCGNSRVRLSSSSTCSKCIARRYFFFQLWCLDQHIVSPLYVMIPCVWCFHAPPPCLCLKYRNITQMWLGSGSFRSNYGASSRKAPVPMLVKRRTTSTKSVLHPPPPLGCVRCYHQSYPGCKKPRNFWENNLTIHGLWPDYGDGT